MGTPFNYAGQPYDPFNQRVRGQTPGYPQTTQAQTQPIQAAAYPTAPSTPTGAYPGSAPSAPVYQGPPVQSSGYYGQQTQPPAYSQQSGQSPSQTSGWIQQQPQQPPQQTPGQSAQQHPGGVTGQGQPYPPPQRLPDGTYGYPAQQTPGQYQQQQPGGVTGQGQAPAPAPAPAARPAAYAMPGWDQGKWANPDKHDAKYDAGRLMSTLAPSVANIPQVLSMLQQAGHQVQYGGGDTAIVDGFEVDMVQGSKSDNPHWQWYVPQAAPSPEQQQPGGMDPYTAMMVQQLMQSPFVQNAQSQQQEAPATGGADQTALLQAIMQLLQQQNAAPRGPVAPNFSFY